MRDCPTRFFVKNGWNDQVGTCTEGSKQAATWGGGGGALPSVRVAKNPKDADALGGQTREGGSLLAVEFRQMGTYRVQIKEDLHWFVIIFLP